MDKRGFAFLEHFLFKRLVEIRISQAVKSFGP